MKKAILAMQDTAPFAWLGIIGGTASAALGGWNTALQTLLIFMAVDYLMGLVVAGVFHKSVKSPDGRLESRAGWKGLVRKGAQLLVVLVGAQLDKMLGASFVRDGIITAFCLNETLSIIENAGLMGIPIPPILARAVAVLRQKSGETEEKRTEAETETVGPDF